jgi:HD-like signal output (HDOD) protein
MYSNSLSVDHSEDYDSVVQKVAGELPSIPILVDNILKMAADADAANFALCNIISMDQSVFSKILKVANSVEYRQGRTDRITDINDAVLRIGSENVRRSLLNTSVMDSYLSNNKKVKFQLEGLWLHSCGVALATHVLSDRYGCEYVDYSYASGLLHDLGKVAKIKFLEEEFIKEINFTQTNNCNLWFAEKALGQIHHNILGSMLIEKWGISPIIGQVAKWHHTFSKGARFGVDDPGLHKLIDLVILANHMIKDLRFGNSGSGQLEELPAPFMRRNRMDEEEYLSAREAVRMHIDAESENLAILLSG